MKKKFMVMGMGCVACAATIEKEITRLPGIKKVEVNLLLESLIVDYDEDILKVDDIIWAVGNAGYGVRQLKEGGELQRQKEEAKSKSKKNDSGSIKKIETDTLEFAKKKDSEKAIDHTTENTLESDRIEDIPVGKDSMGAAIDEIYGYRDPDSRRSKERGKQEGRKKREAGKIKEKLEKCKTSMLLQAEKIFGESENENVQEKNRAAQKEMYKRLYISALFAIPIMVLAMGHMVGIKIPIGATINLVIQVVLVIPIIVINYKYFQVGYRLLVKASPNMDTLIAVGTTAAVIYGYIESAAMILTLVTLGKVLETKGKIKTGDGIAKLIELAPPMATKLEKGQEIEVPTEEIQVGDIVVVRPGQRVPVDGELIEGETEINEAMLTGEPMPVAKVATDKVWAGTVNTYGFFKFMVSKVGEDTTLSQIIKLVEEATAGKPPIAKMADRVAGIFVPVVMGIALATGIVWLIVGGDLGQALSRLISVLVVSCPCALGLATPAAVMVGMGRGATSGILFQSAEALEGASAIDMVFLDKTGTLTEGKPSVKAIFAEQITENQLLALAATLEWPSEHPLGKALVEEALSRNLALGKADDFRARAGQGIVATIEGQTYVVGTLELLEEFGIKTKTATIEIMEANLEKSVDDLMNQDKEGKLETEDLREKTTHGELGEGVARCDSYLIGKVVESETEIQAKKLLVEGKTILYIGGQGIFLGCIALEDTPKETGLELVRELKNMGIKTVMLTGDKEEAATALGYKIGVDSIMGQVRPEEKSQIIAEFQAKGYKTAMVGDGINDGPAIATADVGVAIGSGSHVAIESADVVIVSDNLQAISRLISLSKKTLRVIKENLFWAFFYNVLGIPLAAGVLYPIGGWTLSPMFAAAAMCISSIFVITNALRIARIKL